MSNFEEIIVDGGTNGLGQQIRIGQIECEDGAPRHYRVYVDEAIVLHTESGHKARVAFEVALLSDE